MLAVQGKCGHFLVRFTLEPLITKISDNLDWERILKPQKSNAKGYKDS